MIRVNWAAVGTPRDVALSIADQAKASRAANPKAGATIVAARDELLVLLREHAETETVAASLSLTISVTTADAPPVVELVTDEDAEEDAPKPRRRWA